MPERKVDREDGALAQFALNLNPAVIEIHNVLHYAQPESGPLNPPCLSQFFSEKFGSSNIIKQMNLDCGNLAYVLRKGERKRSLQFTLRNSI